ncbi:hypothetical protein LXA43DRAFT_1105451 [Ganoderma leucocontextum]|nr:hypothetical protein LXA43DRAFT_1105451 [Ganoderma leucocontextum]
MRALLLFTLVTLMMLPSGIVCDTIPAAPAPNDSLSIQTPDPPPIYGKSFTFQWAGDRPNFTLKLFDMTPTLRVNFSNISSHSFTWSRVDVASGTEMYLVITDALSNSTYSGKFTIQSRGRPTIDSTFTPSTELTLAGGYTHTCPRWSAFLSPPPSTREARSDDYHHHKTYDEDSYLHHHNTPIAHCDNSDDTPIVITRFSSDEYFIHWTDIADAIEHTTVNEWTADNVRTVSLGFLERRDSENEHAQVEKSPFRQRTAVVIPPAVFGLALVAYEVRRRRMNNARKEELVARPADLRRPPSPDMSVPPPAKPRSSGKAALAARVADSTVEYSPLSPISFVAREGDDLSMLAARGTIISMSGVDRSTLGPQRVHEPANTSERWQMRALPSIPKTEKRKTPLSPLAAPAIARRVAPFLTRAVRTRQHAQGTPWSGSAVGSSNSGVRNAPATSPSRQVGSPRVASDGGIRLAGGPPGEGRRRGGADRAAKSLPPPYGTRE